MKEKHYVAKRHHRFAAPLGAVFMILAIIGAISVVVTSIRWTGEILNNQGEKKKFERIITPAIIFDPISFEDAKKADPVFLLESSLWADLLNREKEDYIYDDMGFLLVPASDVDVAAKKLYGEDVKLFHQTFGDYEVSYVYDEEMKAYHVPVISQTGLYTPRVDQIVQHGDTYELLVAYIPPNNLWTMRLDGTRAEPDPDKYMTYVMEKSGKDYVLKAIKDLPEDEKDHVLPPSTSTVEPVLSTPAAPNADQTTSSQAETVDPNTATQR